MLAPWLESKLPLSGHYMICGHLPAAVIIRAIAKGIKYLAANARSWEVKVKMIFPDGPGAAKQGYGKILI